MTKLSGNDPGFEGNTIQIHTYSSVTDDKTVLQNSNQVQHFYFLSIYFFDIRGSGQYLYPLT